MLLVVVAAVVLGISLFFTPRRIDLDSQGLTYVPLNPLQRKQNFGWSDLGPVERNTSWWYSSSPYAILQAPILSGRSFRVMGVFRSRKLSLSAMWAGSPRGSALGAEALLSLLDTYRS
jgi:hypothetical protein